MVPLCEAMKTGERTKKWLEKHGYTVGMTERIVPCGNPHMPEARVLARLGLARLIPWLRVVRKDLYGLADMHALKLGARPIFVQATTRPQLSAHGKTALESGALDLILEHSRFWIVGWEKGSTPRKQCKKCDGTGQVAELGTTSYEGPCMKCMGRGYTGGATRWRCTVWDYYRNETGIARRELREPFHTEGDCAETANDG